MTDQEIKQTYDNAAHIILQLGEEIDALTVKFGTSSKIVKSRQDQKNAFIQLYEVSSKELNDREQIIAHLRLQIKIIDMMNFKSQAMLTYTKIAHMYGINSAEFKKVDEKFDAFMIELATLAIETE